jgi:hypothetical protein
MIMIGFLVGTRFKKLIHNEGVAVGRRVHKCSCATLTNFIDKSITKVRQTQKEIFSRFG